MIRKDVQILFFWGVLIVVLSVVLVLLVGALLGRGEKKTTSMDKAVLPSSSFDRMEFLIPNVFWEHWDRKWVFFRSRLKRWNQDQIKQFWVDPRGILLDELDKVNDKKIQELFENIP